MNDIDNLGQVGFMGRLLEDIHGVIIELQDDSTYKSTDAVADLMKLAQKKLGKYAM